jgi:hypothetical protein
MKLRPTVFLSGVSSEFQAFRDGVGMKGYFRETETMPAARQMFMGSAGFQPAVSGILPGTRERAAPGRAQSSRGGAPSRAAQDARRSEQDAPAPSQYPITYPST